jgi:hypothetical protein
MNATDLEALDSARAIHLPESERSRERLLDAMAVRLFRAHLALLSGSFLPQLPTDEASHAQ